MSVKVELRDPNLPDPAEIAAERRVAITKLMDEAVALEDEGQAAEGCHKRVEAICLHLGIRPTEKDAEDAEDQG